VAYNGYTRMPRFRPKGVLERSASGDLWRHTLAQIPSLYGRVFYLASLRDPNSGIYRHHGLSAMFGRDESSNALRLSHEQNFREWIKLPLRGQHADLAGYLASLEDPRQMVVEHWLKSRVYRTLVPGSARRTERELFCRELEALLETLRNDSGGVGKAPASSPHL
jgi:hypothetical protein